MSKAHPLVTGAPCILQKQLLIDPQTEAEPQTLGGAAADGGDARVIGIDVGIARMQLDAL